MKVFKDDSVYIQINDLVKLLTLSEEVPNTILEKINIDEETIINDNNRFKFIKFDNPDEVTFFRKQDWIIDYDNYKDLPDDGLEKIAHELYLNSEHVVNRFNSLLKEEQNSNYGKNMLVEHVKLRHIIHDLRHLSTYKCGDLKLNIPGENSEELDKAVRR